MLMIVITVVVFRYPLETEYGAAGEGIRHLNGWGTGEGPCRARCAREKLGDSPGMEVGQRDGPLITEMH